MNQAENIKTLKENEQQAKQLNEVLKMVNEAVKKEMPTFLKLVQFDVLAEIQKKAVADGLESKNTAEKQLTQDLDKVMGQINKDLEAQIEKKCAELKNL